VRSGSDAARVALRFRPDVVLCDLGLPGKDCFEVAAELRCLAETATVAIIALSGYGTVDDKRRTRQAGFDVHLNKPNDARTLLALLDQLARGGRAVLSQA